MKFFYREPITIRNCDGDPYLTRRFVFKCRWFRVYLHEIHRADDDRDKHDHPWNFLSLLLTGGYVEEYKGRMKWRWPLSVARRRAEDAHRIAYVTQTPKTRTLVFVGKRRREWGFHTKAGWTWWQNFLKAKDCGFDPVESDT